MDILLLIIAIELGYGIFCTLKLWNCLKKSSRSTGNKKHPMWSYE